MTWSPYSVDMLAQLPPCCSMGRNIWQARVPLICFYVVEWHVPDRVLRQFGLTQDIPEAIDTENSLHAMAFRAVTNWNEQHTKYIQIWNDRKNYIVPGGATDIHIYMD